MDGLRGTLWRWRGAVAIGTVLMLWLLIGETGDDGEPGQDEPEDRSPYAEVACEDFTRDAGIPIDDGEISNVTADIYTVQLYRDDARIGTCIVKATGPEEWTLIDIRPR